VGQSFHRRILRRIRVAGVEQVFKQRCRFGGYRRRKVAVIDFFQAVWAWILDWWLLLLLIAAVLAVGFTKPTKRHGRPFDQDPPW